MNNLDKLAAALFDHMENAMRAYPKSWHTLTEDEQEGCCNLVRIVLQGVIDDPQISTASRITLERWIGNSPEAESEPARPAADTEE